MLAAYTSRSVRAVRWQPLRMMSSRLLSTMQRDPDSETGLYYHAISPRTWAVSFLPMPPVSPHHVAVVGTLETSAEHEDPASFLRAHPDDVRMNAAFWTALHDVLRAQIPKDEQLDTEAHVRQDGWAHLCDARDVAMPGRVASPDDIFGSVAFTQGRLDPSTYEPNAMYRFCVKPLGPMKLPASWRKALHAYVADRT